VARPLLGEPLSQGLHQRLEPERLQFGALLGGQIALDRAPQPLGRQPGRINARIWGQRAAEDLGEDDVELVEIALVLDQQSARQAVEILDRLVGEVGVQRAHQVEELARRHRHARLAQGGEEGEKHAPMLGAASGARNAAGDRRRVRLNVRSRPAKRRRSGRRNPEEDFPIWAAPSQYSTQGGVSQPRAQ
jgi:hypothetical protein